MPIDDQEEMFVVVDENDNVIDTATRKECHSNNKIIHRGIHVFILNDKNEVLVPLRSKTKDACPNTLDYSTAGHVSPGETYKQTAIRETQEELGIEINENELIEIGKLPFTVENQSEIVVVFVVKMDIPIKDIKFDKTEVQKVEYYSVEKLKKMLEENEKKFIDFYKDFFNFLCKHFGW